MDSFTAIMFLMAVLIPCLFHFFLRKYLWLAPIVILVLDIFLVLKHINDYSPNEVFNEQLDHFLHNDTMIGIYSAYLPILIIAVYVTIMFHLSNRKKKLK